MSALTRRVQNKVRIQPQFQPQSGGILIHSPGRKPGVDFILRNKPRRGERWPRSLSPLRGLSLPETKATSVGRGYALPPLRGSIRLDFA
jgi:hypothetical protein